jgi:hypothetical protein
MENAPDGGVGSAAETTEARGGSVRASESGPPEVGGRLLLDPGLPSRARSEMKLNELGKPRKDCDCDDDVVEIDDDGGARKDWPGSRKEWLLVGRVVARSMSEL